MGLLLSSRDIAQLQVALRTLTSPLDYRDADAWRLAVNRSVIQLLHADSVLFLLRIDGRSTFASEQVPPRALSDYADYYMARDVGMLRRRKRRLALWSRRELFPDMGTLTGSECYNDWFVPQRYFDSVGMLLDATRTPPRAGLFFSKERFGTEHFGERGLALLSLLKPAFDAGVRSYLRLGQARAQLFQLTDRLESRIAFFSIDSRRLHASPALVTLLESEPDRERIELTMRGMIDAAIARIRENGQPDLAAPPERAVATPSQRYRLRCSFMERNPLVSDPLILVEVEQSPVSSPTPDTLCRRFGLTQREAQVALLLARRQSNQEIAQALHVSPHTARHHTERVLLKLMVHSRDAVAAKLDTSREE